MLQFRMVIFRDILYIEPRFELGIEFGTELGYKVDERHFKRTF